MDVALSSRSPVALAAPAVLEATGLSVGHGARSVLAGIALTVTAGQRWAVVGANGSGKTTLLRVLAGLAAPLGGHIRWAGAVLPTGADRVRVVGVLFQGEPRTPFNVRALVTLGLGRDRPLSAVERHTIETTLDRFELTALANRDCSTLSGGEWQRVTLARAMVAGPRLLVLDEPATHLDLAWRADLAAALARLPADVAVVMATHDLEVAAACDRVLLLGQGTAIGCDAPDVILRPALLAQALGVEVRRVDGGDGARPLFQVRGRSGGNT